MKKSKSTSQTLNSYNRLLHAGFIEKDVFDSKTGKIKAPSSTKPCKVPSSTPPSTQPAQPSRVPPAPPAYPTNGTPGKSMR